MLRAAAVAEQPADMRIDLSRDSSSEICGLLAAWFYTERRAGLLPQVANLVKERIEELRTA